MCPLGEPAIRVVLCDDHPIVRAGLRQVIEQQPDLELVAEAATVAEVTALVDSLDPGVVVMDLSLPDGSGINATRLVREAHPGTAVVVLTVHDDLSYLRQAFGAGAAGYVVKDAADTELVAAIRAVAAGGSYVHPRLGAALARSEPSGAVGGPGGDLSERETQVIQLIAMGLTNGEIADRLHVSVRTVESHRAHIYQKLGTRSRAELVMIAREAGLLGAGPAP